MSGEKLVKVAISGDGDIGSSIAHYPTVAGHADAVVAEPNRPLESRLGYFRFLDNHPLPYEAPRAG